jgi:hypothetical protein
MRKMRVEINESNKKASESVRLGNWNERYCRGKNVKIYQLPENRNEDLPNSLLRTLKGKSRITNPSIRNSCHASNFRKRQ